MKKVTKLMAVAAIAIFAFGACNNPKTTTEPQEQVAVEVETPEGDKTVKVYTFEEKQSAVDNANDQLNKLNAEIDRMKADVEARASELSDEAKAEYNQAIANMEQARDNYKVEVDKLQNATAENWEQFQQDAANAYGNAAAGIEKGWNNVKEGVADAAESMKEGVNDAANKVKDALK